MKITIFGLAWSGTSTVWKLLAEKLGYTFMSSGNIMRSWAEEAWMSIYEYEEKVVSKDNNFDIKLDNEVGNFWKNNNEFIFESRLAWNFIPDSFKIFLDCPQETRYERIQNREEESIEEVTQKNLQRETGLIERYKEVYPEIVFPPQAEVFDLVIDAQNNLPEEIIDIILKHIK